MPGEPFNSSVSVESVDSEPADDDTIFDINVEYRHLKEKFQLVFQHAQELIVIIQSGEIKFVNDLAKLTGGYDEEELRDTSFIDYIHPDDREAALERYLRRISGEQIPNTHEMRIRSADGSYRWTEVKTILIDWDGEPATINFIMDISDRKSAQQELQETEDKYRMVVENTTEGIVVTKDGINVFMNSRSPEMLDYTREDLENQPFIDLIHPEDRERAMKNYKDRMTGSDVPNKNHYRFLKKDGSIVHGNVLSVMIEWEGSNANLAFITDITEEVEARENLKRRENDYELVVENAQEAIVISQDGLIKFMNNRASSFLGYEREEFMELFFLDVIHADEKEKMMERYMARLRGEDLPKRDTYRFIHKDGSILHGMVSSTLIEWEGRPATIAFISDVTDEVQAKGQATEERSKSEFYLDLLGHDIGNLMQGISAWMEMARNTEIPPGRLKMCIDQSWNLSERSKRLVKNVLIISKIRDKEPTLVPLDIVPILERTLKEAIQTFPDKGIRSEIITNGCDCSILAEPIIEEMFYNLIHNGIKFQMENPPRIRIEIQRCEDNTIEISLNDWGPGIPDVQKKGIFHRFKDLTGKKSTGIGLALTKELVERYNGSIEVKDNIEDGKVVGAMFTIKLPMADK